jgi:hypothetical protein
LPQAVPLGSPRPPRNTYRGNTRHRERRRVWYQQAVPPPGAYPSGYPPSPPPSGPKNLKAIIGVVVTIVAILSGVAVFYFLNSRSIPTVKFPTPPGWEATDEDTMREFEETASREGEDLKVDYLFVKGMTDSLAVAHGDAYITDAPDSEDFATVERFFMEQRDELTQDIESAFTTYGIDATMSEYAVKEMACGIPALHMGITIPANGMTVNQDYVFFFKDNTAFFAIVSKVGTGGSQEEVDFIYENISFE